MLLEDHIREGLIRCQLRSRKKAAVIEELAELFQDNGVVKDTGELTDAIRQREKLESTAIGNGVAIPHGRSDSVSELMVVFGRSREGVDFRAVDRKPVHLIFMVAAPPNVRKQYLQIVAKLVRLSKSKVMREALLRAEKPEEVMELIRDFDNMLIEDITVKTKKGRILYTE
jgi:fructose-specific phosphotransferase system IIA component